MVEDTSFSGSMQHNINVDLRMSLSSAVARKMPGIQSEAAFFEKDTLENRMSTQSSFSNTIESLDQETAEPTSQKGMNPSSHSRRLSFNLSRIGRSFSFEEGPAVS